MKKLVLAAVILLAVPAGAFADVICDNVFLCKYRGVLTLSNGSQIDCSGRDCPAILAQSDTPGDVQHLTVYFGDSCQAVSPFTDFDVTFDQDGFAGIGFYFTTDPPDGTPYALGAIFSGCETNGRCRDFVAGSSDQDCPTVGSRALNMSAFPLPTNK